MGTQDDWRVVWKSRQCDLVEVSAAEASVSSCPRTEFGPRSAHWNEKVIDTVVAPSRGLANGFLKSPNCMRGEAVRLPCAGSCRAAAAAAKLRSRMEVSIGWRLASSRVRRASSTLWGAKCQRTAKYRGLI